MRCETEKPVGEKWRGEKVSGYEVVLRILRGVAVFFLLKPDVISTVFVHTDELFYSKLLNYRWLTLIRSCMLR